MGQIGRFVLPCVDGGLVEVEELRLGRAAWGSGHGGRGGQVEVIEDLLDHGGVADEGKHDHRGGAAGAGEGIDVKNPGLTLLVAGLVAAGLRLAALPLFLGLRSLERREF